MGKLAEEDEISAPPPIWRSHRFLVAIFCFFCTLVNYYIKFGVSTAVVCMRGTTANGSQVSDAVEVIKTNYLTKINW